MLIRKNNITRPGLEKRLHGRNKVFSVGDKQAAFCQKYSVNINSNNYANLIYALYKTLFTHFNLNLTSYSCRISVEVLFLVIAVH